jgi:catechol 2,3-dioxygenase-like lactoylglutathione lyase family enzyme
VPPVPDVFDHVTVRVSDVEASRRFYERALGQLGYGEPFRGDHFFEWDDLSISAARPDRPAHERGADCFRRTSAPTRGGAWRRLALLQPRARSSRSVSTT